MELITFESKAYQELLKKIERIAEYISKVETPVPDEKKKFGWTAWKSPVCLVFLPKHCSGFVKTN